MSKQILIVLFASFTMTGVCQFLSPIQMAFAQNANSKSEQTSATAQKEILVRFRIGTSEIKAKEILAASGFEWMETLPALDLYLAKPMGKADPAKLAKSLLVDYYEPSLELRITPIDAKIYATSVDNLVENAIVPNDPKFKSQKHLPAVGANTAWNVTTGSQQVVVAVVDTGVLATHLDLKNQMWKNEKEIPGNNIDDDGNGYVDDVGGWDFANNDADPRDDQSHGTHCAGIIGAQGNNGIGGTGVAWNVKIMAVKFLTAKGSGTLLNGVKGILYAADNGAKIINASWGAEGKSNALEDAVQYAMKKGVLFVAAAGNANKNNERFDFYPSGVEFENVLSVGASNNSKSKAKFSNYGKTNVHVAAPGSSILSTINSTNGYGSKSGTSMAAPVVAGTAALLLSAFPNLSFLELRNAILNSVEPTSGWKTRVASGGFLRTDKALLQFSSVANGKPQIWPQFLRIKKGSSHVASLFNLAKTHLVSSDNSVLTVASDGRITGVGAGNAEIRAVDANGIVTTVLWEVVE
jgi:subtilisin family serine protease